jgi:DNA-binding CsgD family transcriptional regulator
MEAFVGRAAELGALSAIVAAKRAGPVAAVVEGEPGTGKSRLLAEACQRIALAHRFAVTGYETEGQVPLTAAADLLRALGNSPQGSQIGAILLGAPDAPQLEPVRVFEAAHRALGEFARPLLIVDDLQWVDELSLALCHYLIRAAYESEQGLVIFVAVRPGSRGASLTDALPSSRVVRIELEPLSREEGIELVLRVDPTLSRGLAAELWEKAKGSPFWLESLARSGGGAVGLRQVLTVRLRGAGVDAVSLMGLLSVAGRPISLTDAAALAQWPLPRLEGALRELVGRGLVVQTGGTAQLTHDLIREVSAAELPDEVRRRFHLRLAEQLEIDAGSDLRLVRRALEHRRAGGLPTVDLALRLARSPHRKLLGPEGLRLLGEIADESDPFDVEGLALLKEVAALASELAEHEEALARWSLLGERIEAPGERASALLSASRAAHALARVDEARELLGRSQHVAVADEVLELEQVIHDGEIRLWLEQRASEGPLLARHAVGAANRLAAGAGGVGALQARARRAYLDALQLEYEAAVQESDVETMLRSAHARAEGARGFDLGSHLAASVAAAVAARWAGQAREAAGRLRSAWSDANRHVFPSVAVEAGFWLARALEVLGELEEAEQIVNEASALGRRAGDTPRARHRIAKAACDVALQRGRPWEALQRLESETAAESNEHQRIAFQGDLALWTSRLRGPASAAEVRETVAAGRTDATKVGCARCATELLLLSAEALARIGDRNEARVLLATWDCATHTDQLDVLARSRVGALALDDSAARIAQLEASLAKARGSPFRLEGLWTQLDLGLSLAEGGDEQAANELEHAAVAAGDIGAGTVEELAGRALRSLGVRTWRRASAGGPLTEREQEIARLIAEGATNREIAQRLFVSPKTVERHLSNVFRKLGVRNRAELASRASGRDLAGP